MLQREVFVRERFAVDAAPAGAVAIRDVAALAHEVGDHAARETLRQRWGSTRQGAARGHSNGPVERAGDERHLVAGLTGA